MEEKERFYAPPIRGELNGKMSQDTLKKFLLGVTTIKLVCKKCGDIKTVEIIGKEIK
jgi:hypothetical protein